MIPSGEGLRANYDASIGVQFRQGNRNPDLTGITVTCKAAFSDATNRAMGAFDCDVTSVDETIAKYTVAVAGGDLDHGGVDLYLEFFFDGDGSPNPNARPLIIPVRAEYFDAE